MLRVPLNQVVVLTILSLIIGFAVNLLRANGIPIFAKEMAVTESITYAAGEPVAVTLAQARQLYEQGVIFVDARGDEYFVEGHIPRAWKSGSYMDLMFKLDSAQIRSDPIVIYCNDDECGSSETLAFDLYDEGFTQLFVFKGGWQEWNDAGYPIE